jgi:carbamoyltransferase
MTYIIGISAFYHDSAAAILKDGEIIAAAQEERFTRRKHDENFPHCAVEYCLDFAGVSLKDIEHLVFYENPYLKTDRLIETCIGFSPSGFDFFQNALPIWMGSKVRVTDQIQSALGKSFEGHLHLSSHHHAHAASAFFPSPYKEAAILTLDAVGEWATSSIGFGQDRHIHLKIETRFPHSLGMLYSAFTAYTGFKVNSGEYKLMGLAPYGEPKYVDIIRNKMVEIYEDGSIWLDMSYFNYCQGRSMTSEKFHDLFLGPPRTPESMLTQKEMDLAASIQLICEEVVIKAAAHAYKLTGSRNLVMSGGVALNCVANGRLLREGPFDGIWIQPAAGDAGGAVGAGLLVWHSYLEGKREINRLDSQQGSLLGPKFDESGIGIFLDSVAADYEVFHYEKQLLDQVATALSEEKVIGWFQGRMEYGPRALGCRSIIGDARSIYMQQQMNLKIKFRESFRPFAPCVLQEYAYEIFDMKKGEENPYMLFVTKVRDEWHLNLSSENQIKLKDPDLRIRVGVPRSKFPAVTHVDFSARVQTVDQERHGRFYRLMRHFYELTKCPVIVNTSFNIRGEPIVCTPEDAYRCFMATDMDCLVLGNHFLQKNRQPRDLLPGIENYRDQFSLD